MGSPKTKDLILAGDIGGTKTHLGLFQRGKRRPTPRVVETYPSSEAPDLETMIRRFFNDHPVSVTGACFGVAGPVEKGRSVLTNLSWTISENKIKRDFKWEHVRLINDMTATVRAIPLLTSLEVASLGKGSLVTDGNIGLIAPGTGLGMALLIQTKNGYVPVPSEGGHADFGPNDEVEVELWQYLNQRLGHVSAEKVLSGGGLFNIYSWLRDSGRFPEPDWLAKNLREKDPAKVITEAATDQEDPLCTEALNRFVVIFGEAAGNLALMGNTTGGLYLGGGISPKILHKLEEGMFLEAFSNKGRFREFLRRVPVRVILNDKAALLGAAHEAFVS
ncbi:MAG: glucokinase [Deltaproteobacteria bacterium]|nr:glucokinase [Deltaproteobacteria bacterium]